MSIIKVVVCNKTSSSGGGGGGSSRSRRRGPRSSRSRSRSYDTLGAASAPCQLLRTAKRAKKSKETIGTIDVHLWLQREEIPPQSVLDTNRP